jgi:hypothetical protein
MELMDNLSNITSIVPKIVEFPKHFIINTQLYDKQTLKPIPMRFHVENEENPFLQLQTSINKTNYYNTGNGQYQCIQNNNEHNIQNIIQDKNDPNIFYTLKQSFYWADNQWKDRQAIFKIKYNENSKIYTTLNSFYTTSAGNRYSDKGNMKILYETDRYFIVSILTQFYYRGTFSYGYINEFYGIISLLDKNTFEYTRMIGTSFANFLLEGKDDTAYILITTDTNIRQVNKINTSSMAVTTLWTETPITTRGISCNPIKIGDYYYMITTYLDSTDNTYSYKFMKMSLVTTYDTVTTELVDINYNGFVLDNSPNQDMEYDYHINYTLRLIQTDSNTYFSLLMHTVPNMPDWYRYQHKHVLLKMNGDSFDVVDLVPLRDFCYGSLENGDSKHQIYYMSDSVLFYSFDETKEKMICTYRKAGMFMQIGFDALNRFITQTKDYTVEMLTDTNPCVLKADFQDEIYDKDNASTIETTVSFYAKNFLDEYLEVNVRLTLIGPVVFKENNSTTLEISTLKTGVRSVPVTITGNGTIEVIITQNT